jgi:transposase InsO family protein
MRTDQIADVWRELRRKPGKVERYQQTLGREWEKGLTYNTSADRRAALAHWLEHYNTRRHHSGIANVPPLTRVHNLLGQNS